MTALQMRLLGFREVTCLQLVQVQGSVIIQIQPFYFPNCFNPSGLHIG